MLCFVWASGLLFLLFFFLFSTLSSIGSGVLVCVWNNTVCAREHRHSMSNFQRSRAYTRIARWEMEAVRGPWSIEHSIEWQKYPWKSCDLRSPTISTADKYSCFIHATMKKCAAYIRLSPAVIARRTSCCSNSALSSAGVREPRCAILPNTTECDVWCFSITHRMQTTNVQCICCCFIVQASWTRHQHGRRFPISSGHTRKITVVHKRCGDLLGCKFGKDSIRRLIAVTQTISSNPQFHFTIRSRKKPKNSGIFLFNFELWNVVCVGYLRSTSM